jgi:carbon monoxide dehydrogenase subunit G
MQINGQRQLACTREEAWQALNDPKLLQRCIPGCERFDPTGENAYALVVVLGFGPVTTHIRATLRLENIKAPDSYRLVVQSDGGMAGHGAGTADIHLIEAAAPGASKPGECVLDYRLDVQLGGKIAKWGARWTDAAAGTVVNGFFRRFETELHHRLPPADDDIDKVASSAREESATASFGSRLSKAFGRRSR